MKINLDVKRSVAQNAAFYYEKSKKAKRKIIGAKQAYQDTLRKIRQLEKKGYTETKITELKKTKTEWYQKFRWFFSSEGILCIGGRDATTNDILIKKQTEKTDLVFHTDIAGSPFFLAKKGDKEVSITIEEAAIATAAFSRAWKQGITTTEVYYIKPDQVKKELGLPKGSFMIHGKRNYLKPVVQLGVGVYENKAMCGPITAIKKRCISYLIITPGNTKKSDIAKKVKAYLEKKYSTKLNLDEIMQVLPPGDCSILKMQ